MENYIDRNHQLKAIDAIKAIDIICERHHIRYFLIAGSALGAVRHKGMIPWDDDIDIGLQIEEYEKLKQVITDELPKPFVWKHIDACESFPRLSGSILEDDEPLITVFPIIKMGDLLIDKWSQWIIRKVVSPIYQIKSGNKKKNPSLKKRLAYFAGSIMGVFFTKKSSLRVLKWNERRFEKKNTVWSINLYSKYSMKKEMIKNSWIADLERFPFENLSLPLMKDYDEYLTHLYGDYMTPPPESKRIAAHGDYHL